MKLESKQFQANQRRLSPSNPMDWYTHPTPSFERNFCVPISFSYFAGTRTLARRQCSNFTCCCGQETSVDHLKEARVVIDSDGNQHAEQVPVPIHIPWLPLRILGHGLCSHCPPVADSLAADMGSDERLALDERCLPPSCPLYGKGGLSRRPAQHWKRPRAPGANNAGQVIQISCES